MSHAAPRHAAVTDPEARAAPGRYVTLSVNGRDCLSLCDTGADHTVIRRDLLAADAHILPTDRPVKLANNELCSGIMGRAYVDIQLGQFTQRTCVYVATTLCEPCLLGADILTASRAVIDIYNGTIAVHGQTVPMVGAPRPGEPGHHEWRRTGAVRIARTIIVPASSEMILPAKVCVDKCNGASEPRHVMCCTGEFDGDRGLTALVEGDAEFTDKTELCVARLAVTVKHNTVPVRLSNLSDKPVTLYEGTKIADFELLDESAFCDETDAKADFCPDATVAHLEEPFRSQFSALLTKHREVFTGLGRTHVAEHRIPTGDHPPVFQGPRPVPGHLSGEVKSQLDDLVAKGVLEPVSDSEWASPLVLVKRANGGQIRICGDFRRLNSITTPSVQVIPRIDTCLQRLAGAVYFTSLDLKSAYHQLPVAEQDRDKTTIATEFGLYRYTTAPYGIQGIPHSFNRALRLVLSDVPPETVIQYFDDVMIVAKTLEEMHTNLEAVLAALHRSGLTVSLKKLQLCQKEVSFLGFKVSASGVQCDPEKISHIQRWPAPTNAKQVRVFLGLCGYLRRHIRGYAALAKPLTKLTEKHRQFSWGPAEQTAFEELKAALASPPVLALPVFSDESPPFVLDVDASGSAIGGCLMQGDRVIAYASRTLTKAERQYSVTKRELLAVVWASNHFRQYLLGRRFLLRTDHSALQWLFNMKDPTGQLARWVLQLSEMEFDIVHRRGALHNNADALSRYPHTATDHEQRYRWVCVPVTEDRPEATVSPQSAATAQASSDSNHSLSVQAQETSAPSVTAPAAAAAYTGSNSSHSPHAQAHEASVVTAPAVTAASTRVSVTPVTIAEFQREQGRDEGIREMLSWKTRRLKPETSQLHSPHAIRLLREWKRLVVQSSILYRRVQPFRDAPSCLQIVVPQRLRHDLMESQHSGLGGGHQGAAKLESSLRRQFFWPSMQADVKAFCQQCTVCARRKDPPHPPKAPLGSLQATEFLDRLDIDIISGLPVSTPDGYIYVLTCIDAFTRFVWACPLKTQEASEIVEVLMDRVVGLFGVPKTVHSDQGKSLVGNVTKMFYERLGIAQSTTTAYHPQGNGYCERSHRFLMDTVAKLTAEEQRQWPRYLSAAVLAFNANTSAATGLSPYECVFGRPAPLPTALRYRAVSSGGDNVPVRRVPRDTFEYLAGLQRTLARTDQQLHAASVAAHERSKLKHDTRIVEHVYDPGDLVWLRQNAVKGGEVRKLSSRWTGPYRVVDKGRNWTYRIVREDGGTPMTVHHNRLKPCHTDSERAHRATPTYPTRVFHRSQPVTRKYGSASQCQVVNNSPANGVPVANNSVPPGGASEHGRAMNQARQPRSRLPTPGVPPPPRTRSGRVIRRPDRF